MVEIEMRHGFVAMIDDEDADRVRQHRWRPLVQRHTVYAIARLPRLNGKQRSIYMHRLIMDAEPGQKVLHVDKNGLHNTRTNLVVVGTRSPGAFANYPVFLNKDITWNIEAEKWSAVVDDGDGRLVDLGLFDNESDALWAQRATVLQHTGVLDASLDLATLRASIQARLTRNPLDLIYAVCVRSWGLDPAGPA